MSKAKSYAEITRENMNTVIECFPKRNDIITTTALTQIAINLALVVDCMVEIYGSERRKEIDEEK